MSYQVLARKWRPKHFSDVAGQSHIVRTLVNSIKSDKIGHAYLLSGTRGIGKTTIARLFAKAIKCQNLSEAGEPCLTCDSCTGIEQGNSLDYLEIDGASNNSVDDIRDLIENVQYLPTNGKYKVYVIDEVHMLTVNAFNALLKTLEEPPKHVVFIFATTDPQKLLGTVLSRCQRFDFKNASVSELKEQLYKIAKFEGIEFESDDLVHELAKQGNGSFRDALSLMDQVISLSSGLKITEDILYMSLGMAHTKSLNLILNAMFDKDKNATLTAFNQVLSENVDLKAFTKQILDKLYEMITNLDDKGNISSDLDADVLTNVSIVEVMWIYESLTKDFEWALNSFDPEKTCGFSLVKVALREMVLTQASVPLQSKKKSEDKSDNKIEAPVAVEVVEQEVVIEPVETQKKKDLTWDGFLKHLSSVSRSLLMNLERGNLLNKNDLGKENSNLIVQFSEECKIFHDFLKDPENYKPLKQEMADYWGQPVEMFQLNFEVLSHDMKVDSKFLSVVEIEEDKEMKEAQLKRDKILNNKYILNAEELFNTKVDKVVLIGEE